MKKKIIIACMASVLILSACDNTKEIHQSTDGNQTVVSSSDAYETVTEMETGTEKETETPNENPSITSFDWTFSRKYVDKVYNIHIVSEIVGKAASDEWVDNVLLKKSPEEQGALPTVYQMIVDLNISKEDFVKKNNEYIDYPGMYFTEDIISGLYQEDISEMKKLLVNPAALYYDGEIYTFDELSRNTRLVTDIPFEVLNEYLDFIEWACEQGGELKYMQEDINRIRDVH